MTCLESQCSLLFEMLAGCSRPWSASRGTFPASLCVDWVFCERLRYDNGTLLLGTGGFFFFWSDSRSGLSAIEPIRFRYQRQRQRQREIERKLVLCIGMNRPFSFRSNIDRHQEWDAKISTKVDRSLEGPFDVWREWFRTNWCIQQQIWSFASSCHQKSLTGSPSKLYSPWTHRT